MKKTKLNKGDLLKLIVLVAWSLFLLWIYFSGRIGLYVKENYAFLTLIGGLLLLPMAFIQLKNLRTDEKNGKKKKKKAECDHIHFEFQLKDGLICAIFVLPVILGLVVTPQGLNSYAASKRGVQLKSPVPKTSAPKKQTKKGTSDYNELNLLDLLMAARDDPKQLENKTISTIGFVYKGETIAPNSFALLRFVITCCAADAQPIGVLVESEETSQFESDQWVRVRGTVQLKEKAGEKMLVIIADTVNSISKPKDQYLY